MSDTGERTIVEERGYRERTHRSGWELEAGERRQVTGDRRQERGDRSEETGGGLSSVIRDAGPGGV
jgi:hypothetical protein